MQSLRFVLAAGIAAAATVALAQAPASKAPAKAAPAKAAASAPAQAPAPAPAEAAQPAAPKVAGNAEAGRAKVFQCQGCHGIPDWKTAFPELYRVPKLGGQKPEYIVAALRAYKSGERDFATMRAIAGALSDQDVADIAAYYGAQPVTTAERK